MVLKITKRDFIIPGSGIDSVEKISLGGVEQSILIQAKNPTKPVLLFIHGGPCMPIPGVASRGKDYSVATTTMELVKNFTVVFWDQRGAGKSFNKSIPSESIRVEQYIHDCNELIDRLRERFHQDKIYLAAHSWGTVIGLSIASRYPEKLHAYVGISSFLNWVENDTLSYEWLKAKATSKNDKKTLQKLEEIGKPPYTNVKNWLAFRTPLMKHNSMVYKSDTVKHPGMIGGFKIFFTSPDYSILDIFHTFYSAYNLTYTQELIEDFAKINLHAIKKVEVPVYLLHGEQDFHANGKPVEGFYKKLEAPKKNMVWYPNSSHMLHPDDAKQIEQFIIHLTK